MLFLFISKVMLVHRTYLENIKSKILNLIIIVYGNKLPMTFLVYSYFYGSKLIM